MFHLLVHVHEPFHTSVSSCNKVSDFPRKSPLVWSVLHGLHRLGEMLAGKQLLEYEFQDLDLA